MRVDYILMIVDSIESYFLDQFSLSLKRNDLQLRKDFGDVLEGICVDLKGEVEGKIIVSFSPGFADYIVKKMTQDLGIEEGEIEDLDNAALKEIVNQVTASIINRLDEEGYNWDIGVPFLIVNGQPKIEKFAADALVVPYENTIGKMEITVALKEMEQKD